MFLHYNNHYYEYDRHEKQRLEKHRGKSDTKHHCRCRFDRVITISPQSQQQKHNAARTDRQQSKGSRYDSYCHSGFDKVGNAFLPCVLFQREAGYFRLEVTDQKLCSAGITAIDIAG